MGKIGFDSEKYLAMQSEKILERKKEFGGKLYLEFGGKLFDDYHAARVLPGFAPDNKIKMLENLKDEAEIVIVISSHDIEKNKLRADLGITYDADVLRLIDVCRSYGLYVGSVVLSKFDESNSSAILFQQKLEKLGLKVYRHYPIKGYPDNVPLIVSDDGYGKNEYIETERNLIVVTAPGPGSGKMATCLSQLYHEYKRGIKAGYAKYETFPIWNLPLNHPVNIAYEAATADLDDINMIDPWHLQAYGKTAVNYNRDVEIFPVLNAIFQKLSGESPYQSPTDMGVNMAGYCISDDEVCCEASKQEIIRRYYKSLVHARKSGTDSHESQKIALIMEKLGLTVNDRKVAAAAHECEERTNSPSAAIQLPDGKIITGKTSALLGCSSAMLLNAIKTLAKIDDSIDLISPEIIVPVQELKTVYLGNDNPRLHPNEIMVALASCSIMNPQAKKALKQLKKLKGCDVHTTVILSSADEKFFRTLGVNLTSDPIYSNKKLFRD